MRPQRSAESDFLSANHANGREIQGNEKDEHESGSWMRDVRSSMLYRKPVLDVVRHSIGIDEHAKALRLP